MTVQRKQVGVEQAQKKIAEREAKARSQWRVSIGGLVGGISGVTFAFVALLRFESVMLSVVGFLVMGVSLGMVNPEQVMSRLPSFKK